MRIKKFDVSVGDSVHYVNNGICMAALVVHMWSEGYLSLRILAQHIANDGMVEGSMRDLSEKPADGTWHPIRRVEICDPSHKD